MSAPKPITHGTPAGYRAELRRGLTTCHDCRAAHADYCARYPRGRTGTPLGRSVGSHTRRDEVMAEWDLMRGILAFEDFPSRVGMTYPAWERMFYRAKAAGDPRAIRYQIRRAA